MAVAFAWIEIIFVEIFSHLEVYTRWVKFEHVIDWSLRGFNLWLIWWIFSRNTKERKRERERDSNKESRKFATQELILKPNLALLTAFFDSTTKRLEELQLIIEQEWSVLPPEEIHARIGVEITAFKASLDPVKARIVRPLLRLSQEFSSVSTAFETIEDSFTEYLQIVFESKEERAFEKRTNSFQSAFEDVLKGILDGQREFLVSVDAPTSTKGSNFGRRFQFPLKFQSPFKKA